MLDPLYSHSYAKQTAYVLINQTIEHTSMQLALKFWVTCLQELISTPVFSLILC